MMRPCDYCGGGELVERAGKFYQCNHDGTATFNTHPGREIAVGLIEADGDHIADFDRTEVEQLAEELEY